jgi:hypothetical protein
MALFGVGRTPWQWGPQSGKTIDDAVVLEKVPGHFDADLAELSWCYVHHDRSASGAAKPVGRFAHQHRVIDEIEFTPGKSSKQYTYFFDVTMTVAPAVSAGHM